MPALKKTRVFDIGQSSGVKEVEFNAPRNLPEAIRIGLVCDVAELVASGASVWLDLYVQEPDASWRYVCGCAREASKYRAPKGRADSPPSITVSPVSRTLSGKRCKAVLRVEGTANVGLEVGSA